MKKIFAFLKLTLLAFSLVIVTACGGGGGGGGSGVGEAANTAIASIKITPGNVMLTSAGQSRQLSAQAFNSEGVPVAGSFTWSSSKSDVGVDKDGLITSATSTGSATITAKVGSVASAPVLVIIATPVVGTVLVKDAQIVGSPELVDPTVEELVVGTRYRVTLSGVAAPAQGSILMATETAPVGGRVVDVQTSNGQTVVTLETVPLGEMFSALVVNETIDLSGVQPVIPDTILSQYNVTYEANGKMVYTPKVGATAARAKSTRAAASAAKKDFMLGPFSCTSSVSFPLGSVVQPTLTLTSSPKVIFQYDSKDGGLQRFTVKGDLGGELKNSSLFDAAFEGKLECKAELAAYPIPIGGPLSWVVGGQVPVGLGFEVQGKAIAAQVGFDMLTKASASMEMGVACPRGVNCVGVTDFTATADGEFNWKFPPGINGPLFKGKLEPSIFGFVYAEASIGNPILKKARFNLVEGKFGPAFSATLATTSTQMLDPKYESKYERTKSVVVGASSSLKYFSDLMKINLVKIEFSAKNTVSTSPSSKKITANTEKYKVGDTVVFKIDVDPESLNFKVGESNIDEIQILNKQTGQLVTSTPGSQGKNSYTLNWVANESGSIADNFFAFVKTKLIPGFSLKLGPVMPVAITINAIDPKIRPGASVQLTVVDLQQKPVITGNWVSSNPNIVVSPQGVVTATSGATGPVTLTVSDPVTGAATDITLIFLAYIDQYVGEWETACLTNDGVNESGRYRIAYSKKTDKVLESTLSATRFSGRSCTGAVLASQFPSVTNDIAYVNTFNEIDRFTYSGNQKYTAKITNAGLFVGNEEQLDSDGYPSIDLTLPFIKK